MSRILSDLSQRPLPPQVPAVSIYVDRHIAPVQPRAVIRDNSPCFAYVQAGYISDQLGLSAETIAMCHGEKLKPAPATRDQKGRYVWPSKAQRQRRAPRRSFQWQSHPGPMFEVFERATGLRMAVVQGHRDHVLGETARFAKAQGVALSELQIEEWVDE